MSSKEEASQSAPGSPSGSSKVHKKSHSLSGVPGEEKKNEKQFHLMLF